MNIKTITAAAMLLCAAVGCKENDIAFYNESPRLEYVTVASCSFNDKDYLNAYIADEKVTTKECRITAQLIGYLLTEPMTYCLQGAQSQRSDFEVRAQFANPYTFPAAAATSEASVIVTCPTKEQVSTQRTTKSGILEITSELSNPAHQFGAGRTENLVCAMDVTLNIYPTNWDSAWWGAYSTSKYFFMMETLKTTLDQIEKSQANQIRLRQAYNTYRSEYGPLYGDDDESEIEISFPLQ